VRPTYQPFVRQSLPDPAARQRLLASTLDFIGDVESAFRINDMLYHENNPSLALALACARTVQTDKQGCTVQTMLQAQAQAPRTNPEVSAAEFSFDLVLARSFDRASNRKNANWQIEEALGTRILHGNNGRAQLVTLIPRGPALDLTLYEDVVYALMRYNDPDLAALHGSRRSVVNHEHIDVDDFLGQFLAQQPALSGLRGGQDVLARLPCLRQCVLWCLDVLETRPEMPAALRRGVPSGHDGEVRATYQVFCTLWHIWQLNLELPPLPESSSSSGGIGGPRRSLRHRSRPPPQPVWERGAEAQLGVGPDVLLGVVVCLIMGFGVGRGGVGSTSGGGRNNTGSRREVRGGQSRLDLDADGQVIVCALERARRLADLCDQELLDRFLWQVRQTMEKRTLEMHRRDMEQGDEARRAKGKGKGRSRPTEAGRVGEIRALLRPFREFVARTLGEGLPAVGGEEEGGGGWFEIVLAGEVYGDGQDSGTEDGEGSIEPVMER